jgi:hypothetical protein
MGSDKLLVEKSYGEKKALGRERLLGEKSSEEKASRGEELPREAPRAILDL